MENYTTRTEYAKSPLEVEEERGNYGLDESLFDFNSERKWTIGDAVEGTQIFGATGSGKSSGSGRTIATSFIRAGFGGVVLAAKSDELEQWLSYFAAEGIEDPIGEDRLRVISPETVREHHFDPLAYEYGLAPEGGTRRLTNLFMTALGSGEGRVSSDAFWDDTLRELLGHAIDLVAFGNGSESDGRFCPCSAPPSLAAIADVIKTSAASVEEARSAPWLGSDDRCPTLLRKLDELHRKLVDGNESPSLLADIEDTFSYWTRVLPSLADRTRSVVVTSFTAKANDLLRRPLRELFCSGDSGTVGPLVTHDGVIVLVNIPVKRFGTVGEFAQKLYKTVWQHATESDQRGGSMRPTFLWADEAQHFVTKEDVLFQATARSKRAATVYLTQNIPNYQSVLGGGSSSSTDALLGSLQTKIFHYNSDPTTNEWAERLFGNLDTPRSLPSISGESGGKSTIGSSQTIHNQKLRPAVRFAMLAKGTGKPHSAEAVVFHRDRLNRSPSHFLEHRF